MDFAPYKIDVMHYYKPFMNIFKTLAWEKFWVKFPVSFLYPKLDISGTKISHVVPIECRIDSLKKAGCLRLLPSFFNQRYFGLGHW